MRGGVKLKALAEFGDARFFHGDAGGVAVAAEAQENIGHGFQGIEQMKRRNAAA
jgi:hypothetical protein